MQAKFAEDIVSLTVLKSDPDKVVSQTKESRRPILLTSKGKGVAVMQGVESFERKEEERAFMRAVARGLMDIREGKELSFDELRSRLGIEK